MSCAGGTFTLTRMGTSRSRCQRLACSHAAHDPVAHRRDETALLRDVQKRRRRKQTMFGVVPVTEFDSDNRTRRQRYERLVHQHELFAFERASHAGLDAQARHGLFVHPPVKHLMTGATLGLGAVHRCVRVAQEILGPVALARAQSDSDARRREDSMAADFERRAKRFLDSLGHLSAVSSASRSDTMTANSSPPRRATVSMLRMDALRRLAICTRS